MQVTTFTVAGPQAHFRKFYGTNTALSYYLPPRTTVMGLLAARCGDDKGSYHEALHSSQLRIGIGAASTLKKTFHRVNNLKIEGPSDFRGAKGRQQTPLELVTGLRFGRDEVKYRIWISPKGDCPAATVAYRRLTEALRQAPPEAYACCLGAAFCGASIREVEILDAETVPAGQRIKLTTAVAAAAIQEFWRKPTGSDDYERGVPDGIQLEEETLSLDFAPDSRQTTALVRALYPTGSSRRDDAQELVHMPVVLRQDSYRAGGLDFAFLEAEDA